MDPANRLYVVHRPDRDTSGLMMFAKSEEAQGGAPGHNWNNVILQRLYVAVPRGLSSRRTEGMSKAVWPRIPQFVVYSTDNPDEGRGGGDPLRGVGKG